MFQCILRIRSFNSFRSPQVRSYAKPARISNVNLDAPPGEVPVLIPGIAGEYAMNFFESVYEKEGDVGVKTFEKQLNLLSWSVRNDPDWELTRSPLISVEQKSRLVQERLKSLGCSKFFIDSILSLVKSEDITRLDQIRYDFEEIMRAYRREVDVILVTKTQLSEKDLEFYKKSVRLNFLSPKDNIIFNHQVDETITHGYRVTISGQEFDFTWNKDQAELAKKEQEEAAEESKNIGELLEPKEINLNWSAFLKELDATGSLYDPKIFEWKKPEKIKLPAFLHGYEVYKTSLQRRPSLHQRAGVLDRRPDRGL
jgi:F0F1-type ATP synthase delta subunit